MHFYGSVFDKLKWKDMNVRHVITSKTVTMQLLQDLSQEKQEKEKRYCWYVNVTYLLLNIF